MWILKFSWCIPQILELRCLNRKIHLKMRQYTSHTKTWLDILRLSLFLARWPVSMIHQTLYFIRAKKPSLPESQKIDIMGSYNITTISWTLNSTTHYLLRYLVDIPSLSLLQVMNIFISSKNLERSIMATKANYRILKLQGGKLRVTLHLLFRLKKTKSSFSWKVPESGQY